jgi:hypothetical protein
MGPADETLFLSLNIIQNIPKRKVTILGGHNIGHSKQKKMYMNTCSIPNGFRDTVISLYSTLYTV